LGILALVQDSGSAWAQVAATISGTVTDASGGAVPEATVTVRSLETGATRAVTTDEGGSFRVFALAVGQQEVKAEKTGFKTALRTGISLVVGQEAVVNLQLEVGELVQQVTVSAELPLVNTTTAPVSGLVGERQVKDLPLNGRSFDNLLTLNAGAINYSSMKTSSQTSTSNGSSFSVAGRRPLENLFLLNGIEYTGSSQLVVTPGGVSGSLLGIDAVREFNVLTDTYAAEYGKRAGAQVSIVTQSGTNELHGSVFEFLRNSALDARNFFDRDPTNPLQRSDVPAFRRNQFGAAAGGPLQRDRIFLFGNYEGFRERLGISNVAVVPDDAARRGLLPNAAGVPTPVPNLNPRMLEYMSFWPQANGPQLLVNGLPTGTALSFSSPKQSVREDFATLRADYNLSDRDSLSGSYTIDDGQKLTPLADPLFGADVTLRAQVLSLEETHVFSPQVLNTFRVGFSRAGFAYGSLEVASFPPSLSFVEGLGPGGIVIGGGVTTAGLAAITSAGPSNAVGVSNHRNLFTYSDSLQISKGRHQIGAGVWFQRLRANDDTASRRAGVATFNSLQLFLQGTVGTFQAVPNATELGWRSLFGAWYVQDAIKIRPNLTLQLGLRHEFTTGWNEVSGRAANYVTDASGVLVTDTRVGDSAFTENHAKRLFSPRIGLAWDPFRDGKTAIRAGFGTYYTLLDALSFHLSQIPPYNGVISFSNVSLPSILPIVPNRPLQASCTGGTGIPPGCTIFSPAGVQPDARTPTVQEWNFSVEQELSPNIAVRLAYVGSFGYHSLLSIDPNSIPAQICSNPSGCVSGGVLAAAARGQVAQGQQYIPVGTRPNRNLSGGFFWYTEGNSSYNALQMDVTRRLSQGWQLRANYTWSKNLDMNSALTIAQAVNQPQLVMDRNDLRRDWGPSALNVTHQASISGAYELPFGRGKRWLSNLSGVTDKLASGWQWNGIVTLLSGFPFTPLAGLNRSGDGNVRNPDRPSLNPSFSGPVVLENPSRWFDPNAFILPTSGTWGNLGRGVFRGPGLASLDLSLFKTTSLSERTALQFRVEGFNVLNRSNLGAPTANVFSAGAISPTAGLITTTATLSRQIQFGLKLIF
jgi:hypothetical protein